MTAPTVDLAPPPPDSPEFLDWAKARREELAASIAVMPRLVRRGPIGWKFRRMLADIDEYLAFDAAWNAASRAED
ncbi:MAG: hypothetical protein ACYDB6_02910 [Candidatus Limnocylindrales bacterium]